MRPGTHKTAYELWKGKKPNLSYFHVFGCTCYILNDREHLSKFQAKSDKGIFLGYFFNSRAYRIFNLRTKTIMESVNVVIDDLTGVARPSSEKKAVDLTVSSKNSFRMLLLHPLLQQKQNLKVRQNLQLTQFQLLNQWTLLIKLPEIHQPESRRITPLNIIGDLNEGMKTRDKPKMNYHDCKTLELMKLYMVSKIKV